MDQDTINEREWRNQANWSGPDYCRCYFSKADSRLVVRKWNPVLGWTVNCGHKYGFSVLLAGFMVPLVGLALIVLIGIIIPGKVHRI